MLSEEQTRELAEEYPVTIPYKITVIPIRDVVEFDGARFHTVSFRVPTDIVKKGVVLIVHGFGETFQAYYRAMDDLAKSGYDCYCYDQRGSGYTSYPDTTGRTTNKQTFGDLNHFIELVSKDLKQDEKLYLLGHSMGGGISLNYSLTGKYRAKLAGVITTGPLVRVHPKTRPNPFLYSFLRGVCHVMPNMVFKPDLKAEYLSSDEEFCDWIVKTPVVNPIGTLLLLRDMLDRGMQLLNPKYIKSYLDGMPPVLIIHGEEDGINDVDSSEQYVALVQELKPSADITFVKVSKGRHQLLNEATQLYDPIMQDAFSWLNKH